jgi:hypothetical protein
MQCMGGVKRFDEVLINDTQYSVCLVMKTKRLV